MNTKLHYTTFLVLLLTTVVSAQDATFSQFYNAPMSLNPAEMGHRMNGGKYRLNSSYRDQWSSLGSGFKTVAVAVDNTADYKEDDYVGFGLSLVHDESPSGAYRVSSAVGGMSAHIAMDRRKRHYLSVGGQIGAINTQVRYEELVFENDILGGEAENFINGSVFNLDTRLGILYSHYPAPKGYRVGRGTKFKAGFSVNHFVLFESEFITRAEGTRRQFVFYTEFSKLLTEKWEIQPHFLFLSQGTFEQNMFGVLLNYNLFDSKKIIVGSSFRTSRLMRFNEPKSNDALIAIFGVSFKNDTRFFASYDVNISPLMAGTNGRGALEFGVQYVINSSKDKRKVSPTELFNLGDY